MMSAGLVGAAPVDRSSAKGVVQSFYAWYLHHDYVRHDAIGTRPYLASGLYRNLRAIVIQEKCVRASVPIDSTSGLTRRQASDVSVSILVVHATDGWASPTSLRKRGVSPAF